MLRADDDDFDETRPRFWENLQLQHTFGLRLIDEKFFILPLSINPFFFIVSWTIVSLSIVEFEIQVILFCKKVLLQKEQE